jgi:hypothetical protein
MTPSLAESWTVSADQRVYEFKLREGLKFHNGDAFTVEDVKFSFNRAKGSKVLHDKVHGGYPDIDALYKEQALVTDRSGRPCCSRSSSSSMSAFALDRSGITSGRAAWGRGSRSRR